MWYNNYIMYSLTLFNSLFDNKTDKQAHLKTWDEFEGMLYTLSKKPGYKAKKYENKKSSPLVSPAIYAENTTRSNKNVLYWGSWAAVDVDEHIFQGNLEDELKLRFGAWYYVCYSTASSTIEKPKFRLVFPLTENIPAEKIRHFWYALNTELNSIGDRQTKDLSRMYYIPAVYPNANNFIFTNRGYFIDPNTIMANHNFVDTVVQGNSFFDRLPEDLQKKVIDHRKNQINNTSYTWKSYRDCPFINRKLVSEYNTISETGWYAKMYQLMVSIAMNAIKKNYPITALEVAELCGELDRDNGNWYENRPLKLESERAIEYAYRNI